MLNNIIAQFQKNRHLKYGVPFVICLAFGLFGLREFQSANFEFRRITRLDEEEIKRLGIKKKKRVTLEEVFEEIQKIDIDNWENKRIPRPYDETPPTY